MRQHPTKSWLIPAIVCAIAISVVMQLAPRNPLLKDKSNPQGDSHPSTYIVGMRDRTYDKNGTLKHTLHAQRVNYYQNSAESRGDILAPEIEFYSEGKAPWHLSAERGTVNNIDQTLKLEQDVSAYSDNAEYGKVTILTEDLLIHTERQYAHTPKPVTILSARGKTTAVGLNAALEEGQIELLAEVKSLYDPL